MSGYRSLHRENVVHKTAIWSVATSAHLVAPQQSRSTNCWRIWTACADGITRVYRVQETSVDAKQDVLDASALSISCTHELLGKTEDTQQESSSPPPAATERQQTAVLGCTRVCLTRNYQGEDRQAGDLVALSLDLSGKVRVWNFSENLDGVSSSNNNNGGEDLRRLRALFEFNVENSTGTTAALCPPRLGVAENDVVAAIGCLDGTIALVATGLQASKKIADSTKKNKPNPLAAGTLVGSNWGNKGSAVPLTLCWHPSTPVLAVGRQNGAVSILAQPGIGKHQQHHLTSAAASHNSPVRAVCYSDYGNLLTVSNDEGSIRIWDVSRTVPVIVHHVLQAHDSWILDCTFLGGGGSGSSSSSSGNRRFLTAGADKRLHVWDVGQLHQPVHTFQTDHSVWTIDCGGPGAQPRLVTGSDSGWLQVYSIES